MIDLQYQNSFVLTYSYYTRSSVEFLDLLAQRFLLVSVRMSKVEASQVGALKITLFKYAYIALVTFLNNHRVVNLVKAWIEMHIDIVKASDETIERIKMFAEDTIEPVLPSLADNLTNYLETKLQKDELISQEALQFNEKPPKMKKVTIRRTNMNI